MQSDSRSSSPLSNLPFTKRPPTFRPTSSPTATSTTPSSADMSNNSNGYGLHVATPAKQAKRFGGMSLFSSSRDNQEPPRRPQTPTTMEGGAVKKPKIRANVTPDAKSRLFKSNAQPASGSTRPPKALVEDEDHGYGDAPPPVPKVPSSYTSTSGPSATTGSSIRVVQSSNTASSIDTSSSLTNLHRLALSSPTQHSTIDEEPHFVAGGRNRIVSASQELELGPDGEEVGFNDGLFSAGANTFRAGGRGRTDNETVLVTVRVRPISSSTLTSNDDNAWEIPREGEASYGGRSIRLADGTRKEWVFDRVLPPSSTNAEIYSNSARPHIHAAMSGYNAVIFAYGQTASGKTFTLTGTREDPGVIPRSVEDVFRFIKGLEGKGREWVLRASYLELYNETLCDLLGPGGGETITILNGKKDGEVQIHGLTEMVVTNVGEVKKVLEMGERRRRTGVTDWNERSSRSHSVFRIVIESRLKGSDDEFIEPRTPAGKPRGSKATRISCLSLIDLAGSEKATGSKERNAEGKYINQSLLTLKNVISKLAEQSARKTTGHVPFRDSKLTRLLQPSLSGDARISVICTINPSQSAITESQSTLGFAAGVKRVVLNAQKTEVVDPAALIQQYQTEIAELKAKLAQKDAQLEADGPQRRMTVSDKQERNNFTTRLNELKRLILTSATLEEEEREREAIMRPVSPSRIDHELSTFSLQEQLHIANTRLQEQADRIKQLQADLAVRPLDPHQRCLELQTQVDQLTEMNKEYEKNLLDPGQKVREDVEAEWLPKVQALEARAKEKELFYKELFDDVHRLKSENVKLKERCDRLEADKQQFILAFRELDENTVESPPKAAQPPKTSMRQVSHSRSQSTSASVAYGGYVSSMPPPARPLGESNRVSSISMAKLASNLAAKTHSKAATGKGLRDDSLFDLAARAAYVAREDEEFF